MSPSLPRHVRRAVRTATIVAGAAAVLVPGSAAVAQTPGQSALAPLTAVAPATPWTSVSEVLTDSLQRMQTAAASASAPAPAPAPSSTPKVFATVDGVELVEPHPDLDEIGFHEGSTQGLSLSPRGRAVGNDSGFDTPADGDGPEYRVMSSRGRSATPTSAVDLAMRHQLPVHAPVTGTVVSVSPYNLYGQTADVLVEIVPDGRSDLKIQVFHIEDVVVEVGERVVAGVTTIAAHTRQLPFGSQIDKHVGHAGPHVHIQAVRA
jgi:murein DD-endopeptidase MepM/ murein hydrolase activator NlpD